MEAAASVWMIAIVSTTTFNITCKSLLMKRNWNSPLSRREWMTISGGVLFAARTSSQSKLLPLNSSGQAEGR